MTHRGSKLPALSPELWRQVELACVAGLPLVEAAKQFGIKENTLRKRASSHNWPTPTAIARRTKQLSIPPTQTALDTVAGTWQEKSESHRLEVFEKASTAIAKSRMYPPKNWKDFDIADKAARRAAGLDNIEVLQQTLVNINEMAEGEVIDLNSESLPLPDTAS